MSVSLYDTTLRDGAQQEGISLSLEDKLKITLKLDELGVHYIEGGTPGSNPKDVEYFQKVKALSLSNAKITAFGLTRRAGSNVKEDDNIRALLESGAQIITLVAKSSDTQVTEVLETSLEENLSMIFDSVSYLKERGRTVFLDAEHFFDGYRSNPDYALKCLSTASEAGADSLELCDTNGGALPNEIETAIAEISKRIGKPLGIHCHDDADLAVANTLVAVAAGVSNVQGSINGYGERCGNANLLSIIANLKLKYNIDCVSDEQLSSLTDVSHYVSEIVNIPPNSSQPYVGASAFSHKGGLHASAVAKMEDSYQHVSPGKVGNEKRVLISELSGRSNLEYRIKELGLEKEVSTRQVADLLENIKVKENKGFQYEVAEASFDLMVMRNLPNYKQPFELVDFMVVVENRRRSPMDHDNEDMLAEAMVKVRVGQELNHTVAEGNGPVNALDNALRKALIDHYPSLGQVKLLDYKVRVVDQGHDTQAVVRVLVECSDGSRQWQTVGASGNIIEASWQALSDGLEYFLARKP